jgi:hypothetical protein
MKTKKKSERGGALLAVLLLIPVMTVGGLVSYKIANNSSDQSMRATLNENATYSASNVSEIVLATIVDDIKVRDAVVNTAVGAYVNNEDLGFCDADEVGLEEGDDDFANACAGAPTFDNQTDDRRYKNITTLFLTKRVEPLEDAEPNTIAIQITVRTYNEANPSWNSADYVEHSTYQEFNMGLVKPVGCAAKYDFFADNEYIQTALISLDMFSSGAYYAGDLWQIKGLSFSIGQRCIDTPGKAKWNFLSLCGFRADCNATDISFEHALYGDSDGDDNGTFDRDEISNINIDGTDGSNPYTSNAPYPHTSLDSTVISKISHKAAGAPTHEAAFNIMKNDGDVTKVGNWYFRDDKGNGIPDLDTPYFYYDGDLTDAMPFSIDMFRFRNVYVYVNGSITDFQLMGSGAGFNFGQLYLMAKTDFISLKMMNMSMANAGLVILAGGDVTNGEVMSGSGIGSGTIMANGDIKLNKGMGIEFGQRSKMFAGDDIEVFDGFTMSGFNSGGNNGECGCTGGSEGESTEMQIGRRFSTS